MTIAFSVFGSKSKFVQYYPPPKYDLIIEPFAGGANYALRYWRNDVLLHDLNEDIIAAWHFLQRDDAAEWVGKLPSYVHWGREIHTIIPKNAPDGMIAWLKGIMSRGSMSTPHSTRTKVTQLGADVWNTQLRGTFLAIKMIKHWEINLLEYKSCPNQEATWFIDPPYQGRAGELYVHGSDQIDYKRLGEWCKSRKGQVIVCEMEGANWLPFEPFHHIARLGKNRATKYKEVVWMKN